MCNRIRWFEPADVRRGSEPADVRGVGLSQLMARVSLNQLVGLSQLTHGPIGQRLERRRSVATLSK